MTDKGNSSSREGFYALLVALFTLVGAVFAPLFTSWYASRETKLSEGAALSSEVGYLCRAMSWQVVYLGSNENPDSWRSLAGQNRLTEIGKPDHAWSRPSWFPFRTPAWNGLKDKVGNLDEEDARTLTDFFNRVEFLNVLHARRHCYSNSKDQFWHM
jgi:hypothetical protein